MLPNKFGGCVFIGGPSHSGTSIITRVISNHSRVLCPNDEMKLYEGTRLEKVKKFSTIHAEMQRQKKSILVEKTPGNIARMGTLRRLAPGCRFILTMRDFRDVIASQKTRRNGRIEKAILSWEEAAIHYLRAASQDDVTRVNYEDFVESPEKVARSLFSFIGVEYEEHVLDTQGTPKL